MTLIREATCQLPTPYGTFTLHVYREQDSQTEHVALVMGELNAQASVLTRLHSECLTGDVLGSRRCDCGEQLKQAQQKIGQARQGVILYLRHHEGRGIGLTNKIRAYAMQEQGLDTVDANIALGLPVDGRDYRVAAEILKDLHISSIRLMSNNPDKHQALLKYGIQITGIEPIQIKANDHNASYLDTKRDRLGHFLPSETST